VITALPLPTAVTTPLPDTVAADVFDDDQLAWLVTSCVVPLESVAVAVNCDVAPTTGAAPVTLTDVTELAAVLESPHAAAKPASPRTMIAAIAFRIFIHTPYGAGILHGRHAGSDRPDVAEVWAGCEKSKAEAAGSSITLPAAA
jgi:hypothetical protein